MEALHSDGTFKKFSFTEIQMELSYKRHSFEMMPGECLGLIGNSRKR